MYTLWTATSQELLDGVAKTSAYLKGIILGRLEICDPLFFSSIRVLSVIPFSLFLLYASVNLLSTYLMRFKRIIEEGNHVQ